MLKIFKVTGDSLYPFYKNGQRVLCFKLSPSSNIHINDTIVFEKKSYGLMIKKVKSIDNDTYFVEGTNPFSVDSRDFGSLERKELKYKVFFKF